MRNQLSYIPTPMLWKYFFCFKFELNLVHRMPDTKWPCLRPVQFSQVPWPTGSAGWGGGGGDRWFSRDSLPVFFNKFRKLIFNKLDHKSTENCSDSIFHSIPIKKAHDASSFGVPLSENCKPKLTWWCRRRHQQEWQTQTPAERGGAAWRPLRVSVVSWVTWAGWLPAGHAWRPASCGSAWRPAGWCGEASSSAAVSPPWVGLWGSSLAPSAASPAAERRGNHQTTRRVNLQVTKFQVQNWKTNV